MTNDADNDALARQLAEHAADRERAGATLTDDILRAYRAGTLDADAAADVEARLARDPMARERLVHLSGAGEPPAALRERVLRSAGARQRARPSFLALAAVIAGLGIAMTTLLWSPSPSPDWPASIQAGLADRAFELNLSGLAEVRSSGTAAQTDRVTAYLDTPLRATLAADATLPVPLFFGVFVEQTNRWVPVDGATIEAYGSAAEFTLTPRAAGAAEGDVLMLAFVASGVPLPNDTVEKDNIDARWHVQRARVEVTSPQR
ncbi:MAG: hypothetical protein AAFU65_06525 [Pseudomonadota bacterium]